MSRKMGWDQSHVCLTFTLFLRSLAMITKSLNPGLCLSMTQEHCVTPEGHFGSLSMNSLRMGETIDKSRIMAWMGVSSICPTNEYKCCKMKAASFLLYYEDKY